MATRFYFPVSTGSPMSPTQDAGWNYTSEITRGWLSHVKGSSAITLGTRIGAWSNTAGQRACDRIFVSDPLFGDQTISGTCKGQVQVQEFATTDNADQIIIKLYVLQPNGTTIRGTCLTIGAYGLTAEFISNATAGTGNKRNKRIADGDTITSVNAISGDRLVLEIGYANSTAATTPEAQANWGETGTDLPEDETTTAAAPGWFELSANLIFESRPTVFVQSLPDMRGRDPRAI